MNKEISLYKQSHNLPQIATKKQSDGSTITLEDFGISATINNSPNSMSVIIPSKAPLPAHNTKRYHPTTNYQKDIKIRCYKGQSSYAPHNTSLGEFIISGLLPRTTEQSQGIDLTFTITKQGTVLVDAIEVENPANHLKVKLQYHPPENLIKSIGKKVAKEFVSFFLPSSTKHDQR